MMRKTMFTISGILIFTIATWIIINLVLNLNASKKMPDDYEISFGYTTNDSNFDFVDSAEIFTKRAELKAKITFPELSNKNYKGIFRIKSINNRTILQEFKMNINKGVSGQLFNLKAVGWPSGTYECTFEVNGRILAINSFSLQ